MHFKTVLIGMTSLYLTTSFFEYKIVKIKLFELFQEDKKWNIKAEMYQ